MPVRGVYWPLIMAARPARLQFAYLGHSHSLFAPWLDYRISDRASEPEDWAFAATVTASGM